MKEFKKLVWIVDQLRGENGCDWDRKQTFESMKKYILEETYELLEAMDSADQKEIEEEIGDVCMNMVFLSRMAQEKGWFDIRRVLEKINEKLIYRHPHVFGETEVEGVKDILKNWEKLKQTEKKERNYLLDGIPLALPSILRAIKIQEKLDRVGFNWGNPEWILDKVEEELEEMKAEIRKLDKKQIEAELGDILFVLVNLALKMGVDPESALQQTNRKVIRRFFFIEEKLRQQNRELSETPLEEMETLWQEAKKVESRK